MKPKNSILKDTRDAAAVGIGTMIVFIATVLVAAIAAGVLIDMSGKLQSQSQATGSQATEQVASNIDFRQVIGKRTADTCCIDEFEIFVGLAAGASEVDLSQVRLIITNGTDLNSMSHEDEVQASLVEGTEFNATAERDVGGGFTSASPVMTPGDLVRLETNNDLAGYPVRDDISITISPETGADATISFRTPNSFGSDTVIQLA